MADLKISQLTDGNAAQATDEFVVARSGANFRIDGASVAAAATSVGTLSSLTVSGDLTVDTNVLKVDSSANNVIVGATSTTAKLAVANNSNDGTSDSRQYGIFGTAATYLGSDAAGIWGGGLGEVQIHNGTATRPAMLSLGGSLNAAEGLGTINFFRSGNEAGYRSRAQILSIGTNTGTANRYGGDLRFYTAADGATNPTERLRIDTSGNLGLGVTPATKLDVQGDYFTFGSNRTNNTTKFFGLLLPHYANATNPINVIGSLTTGGINNVFIGGSDSNLTGTAATSILFYTAANATTANGTERARITSGGYFKASSTGTYYNVSGTEHELTSNANEPTAVIYNSRTSGNNEMFRLQLGYAANNTSAWFVYCSDGTAQRASIRSNGGLANYQSNNVDLSDARTKTDITPAASMWDKVAALEIVTYKYNDQTHDDVNVGVIAQQVETVEPVWVDNDGWDKETSEGEEPLKTVYTKDITFAAIKALQEAMARIEALEARLEALEA